MTDRIELLDSSAPQASQIWQELEALVRPPYFLTWGWIENWLSMLNAFERPRLAVARDRDGVSCAFFLGRRRLIRHRLIPSYAMYLNSTGFPDRDELCVEHNGVLARPGASWSLAKLVAALPDGWDELFLPACATSLAADLGVPRGFRVKQERVVVSPYVELDRVRASGDYLALVSANTRAQIRRARRRVGPCELAVARDVREALAIYDELVELHAATWTQRGQPGAFADPWFRNVHRRLIEQRFAHGEIQLARLRDAHSTIGCVYNLVANGRVLFYQSGLAASSDPVVKPGYLIHAATIEHNAKAGHDIYDLLGGDSRYKSSLATASVPLAWLRVQRERVRFAVEDRLRDMRDVVVAARTQLRTTGMRETVARVLDRSGALAATMRVRGAAPIQTLGIFTFHRVEEPSRARPFDPDIIDATPDQFRRRVAQLARIGSPIGIDTLVDALDGRRPLPPNPIMITFDDGYRSCRDVALPILRELGVPATFFIATNYARADKLFWWEEIAVILERKQRGVVELTYPHAFRLDTEKPGARRMLDDIVKETRGLDAERFLHELRQALGVSWSPRIEAELAADLVMTWDDVRALAAAGMSIGSHTRSHRVLDTLPDDALRGELAGSRADLEAQLGRPIRAIAYPVGRRPSPRVRQQVVDAGYEIGFTNYGRVNRIWPRWARTIDRLDFDRLPTDRFDSDAMFLTQVAVPSLAYAYETRGHK